jgi:hypothetical protein
VSCPVHTVEFSCNNVGLWPKRTKHPRRLSQGRKNRPPCKAFPSALVNLKPHEDIKNIVREAAGICEQLRRFTQWTSHLYSYYCAQCIIEISSPKRFSSRTVHKHMPITSMRNHQCRYQNISSTDDHGEVFRFSGLVKTHNRSQGQHEPIVQHR